MARCSTERRVHTVRPLPVAMVEATDYYHTLELDASAPADAVKQAYRRLALACHPDHHPGDAVAEERFKCLQSAYEVLVDPARRAAYDRTRRTPFGRSSLFDAPGRHEAGPRGVLDFFFNTEAPARGSDVEAQLQLTFDQALRGGTTDLPVHSGEAVRLVVPRGVRSGVRIRVSGRGAPAHGGLAHNGLAHGGLAHGGAGPGGTPGDLYVTLRVDASPRFRREGDHLHLVETVSALEAILGTARSITNAYGQTIRVAIPAGTQPGERLRLRGQGVATDKRTGDLFVEVSVTVPRALSDAQRAELERAARAAGLL